MRVCPECGASLDEGRDCRDYFHDLLGLEAEVPGGPGPLPHFFAVASYNLQHPSQFAPDVLPGLRAADRFTIRVGIGLVIAHGEGRIAGERVGGTRRTFLGGSYHLAGVTAQVAAGRRYPFGRGRVVAYAMPEAKVTASLARLPLGDGGGSIFVPNVAAHVLAGLGVRRIDR